MSLKIAKKLLVVDDDAEILRIVRDTVQSFLGWDVVSTVDSVYGFELALREDFDLYLFDLVMPRMGGDLLYELLGKVQTICKERTQQLPPLLLLSGHGQSDQAQELLSLPGVRGILPKPFEVQRMLDKLEECVA